tara:strand:+ start:18095 stop:18397 length:303 start_codon:yes stop_codon:yes gene_type:complete
MDWLQILEQYGLPLVGVVAFWMFIQKQNKFIQEELQKELRESFERLEGIVINLINQQKKMQIEQKGIKRSFEALVEIIAALSGNGLKHKFMRTLEKKDKE